MKKTALFPKLSMLFLFPVTLFFLSGCVSTQEDPGADWEPWNGKLTGMIDADLRMFFSRIEEEKNVYLVKGNFKGKIARVSGDYGSGTMNAKLEGQVKDGIFNVRMWGNANVSAGSATIDGKIIGTLSKTQAFGTWNMLATDTEGTLYEFSGEWSAEKTDS